MLNVFSDPTDAINGAINGDSANVDMSVGDIYGGEYHKLKLDSRMIASSFGKIRNIENPLQSGVDKNDVAKSLLTMVSVNNLILSKMISELEGIKSVVWIGAHIDILEYMQMLQYNFQFLTNGDSKLVFPTYHSFLGSMGLLLNQKCLDTSSSSDDEESSEEEKTFEEIKQESTTSMDDGSSYHEKSIIYPDY
jgi:type II pantothenate kinase